MSVAMVQRSMVIEASRKQSSSPGSASKPNSRVTCGLATSASTSSTRQSFSRATLIAKLMHVNVLPSPGTALVTAIEIARAIGEPRAPAALANSGRLICRYSSTMRHSWLSGAKQSRATQLAAIDLDDVLPDRLGNTCRRGR